MRTNILVHRIAPVAILCLSVCLSVGEAEAGLIQVDAVSSGSGTANSTYTLSHTVAVKTNRVLVVGSSAEDADTGSECLISSITYAAVAMSSVFETTAAMPPFGCASLFYLLAPTTGTNNVVVTWNGTVSSFVVGAMSLYGVKQVAPEGGGSCVGTGFAPATTISATVNVASIGEAIIDVVTYTTSGALTPDGSQVEKYDVDSTENQGGMSLLISTATGDQSVGWTGTESSFRALVCGAFFPFRGAILPASGMY